MSRVAIGIDFDRWVARVYAMKIAELIRTTESNSGVVGVPFETPFEELATKVQLFGMGKITEAPFRIGGYFDRDAWTVTQGFKDIVCSFSKARLPENDG